MLPNEHGTLKYDEKDVKKKMKQNFKLFVGI